MLECTLIIIIIIIIIIMLSAQVHLSEWLGL